MSDAAVRHLVPEPATVEDLLDLIASSRPRWHADALCREHPEVSFFPERGAAVEPARAICGQCLVAPECLAWALRQDTNLIGVWGGTTPGERQRLRKR